MPATRTTRAARAARAATRPRCCAGRRRGRRRRRRRRRAGGARIAGAASRRRAFSPLSASVAARTARTSRTSADVADVASAVAAEMPNVAVGAAASASASARRRLSFKVRAQQRLLQHPDRRARPFGILRRLLDRPRHLHPPKSHSSALVLQCLVVSLSLARALSCALVLSPPLLPALLLHAFVYACLPRPPCRQC